MAFGFGAVLGEVEGECGERESDMAPGGESRLPLLPQFLSPKFVLHSGISGSFLSQMLCNLVELFLEAFRLHWRSKEGESF